MHPLNKCTLQHYFLLHYPQSIFDFEIKIESIWYYILTAYAKKGTRLNETENCVSFYAYSFVII